MHPTTPYVKMVRVVLAVVRMWPQQDALRHGITLPKACRAH